MRGLERHERTLAVLLSALAGYVDSLGFLQLGGLFVSFMSGNSTRLAVGISHGDWKTVGTAGLILVVFVVGAMLGGLLGRDQGQKARSRILAVEAILLAAAAAAALTGHGWISVSLMVLAMGLENAVFLREGVVGVGLTYMTGALVKLGHSLARAVRGEDPMGFLPHLQLWFGLFAGAVLGAFAYRYLGLHALWLPAAVAALLSVVTRVRAA
ncbi:YoaK family protein [Brevundimonas vesicularis]|uniref:YoaK family protein n=1 Tax=Brevundimonas vesicularis TaxID=41276 RepID=UPI0038D504E0